MEKTIRSTRISLLLLQLNIFQGLTLVFILLERGMWISVPVTILSEPALLTEAFLDLFSPLVCFLLTRRDSAPIVFHSADKGRFTIRNSVHELEGVVERQFTVIY
jgi:hypothetical protein